MIVFRNIQLDGQIMNMHALVYEIFLEFSSYKIFEWVNVRGYV